MSANNQVDEFGFAPLRLPDEATMPNPEDPVRLAVQRAKDFGVPYEQALQTLPRASTPATFAALDEIYASQPTIHIGHPDQEPAGTDEFGFAPLQQAPAPALDAFGFAPLAEIEDNTDALQAGWGEVFSTLPGATVKGAQLGVAGVSRLSGESNGLEDIVNVAAGKHFSPGALLSSFPDMMYRLAGGEDAGLRGFVRQKTREWGTEAGTRYAEDLKDFIPENMSDVQQMVHSGLTSAGQAIPLYAASLLARTPHLVAGGLTGITVGREYHEAITDGALPATARSHAIGSGILEYMTELPVAQFALKMKGPLIDKVAGFLMREIPGENVAEVGQLVSEWLHGLRDEVTLGDILHTMYITTGATIVGGGAQAGAIHTMNKTLEKMSETLDDVVAARREKNLERMETKTLKEKWADDAAKEEGTIPPVSETVEYSPLEQIIDQIAQEEQLIAQLETDILTTPEGTTVPTRQELKDAWVGLGDKGLRTLVGSRESRTLLDLASTEHAFETRTTVTGQTIAEDFRAGEMVAAVGFNPETVVQDSPFAPTDAFGKIWAYFGMTGLDKADFGITTEAINKDPDLVWRRIKETNHTAQVALAQMVEAFRVKFAPNVRLIVSDGNVSAKNSGGPMFEVWSANEQGHAYQFHPTAEFGTVNVININPQVMMRAVRGLQVNPKTGKVDFGKTKTALFHARSTFFATNAHELGHAVVEELITQADPKVQKALLNAWKRRLRSAAEARKRSIDEMSSELFGYKRGTHVRDTMTTKQSFGTPNYMLSFPEFIAEQTVAWATNPKNQETLFGADNPRGFWQAMTRRLRDMFEFFKTEFGMDEKFEAFMEQAIAKVRLTEKKARLEAFRESEQQGTAETVEVKTTDGKTVSLPTPQASIIDAVQTLQSDTPLPPGDSNIEAERGADAWAGDVDTYNKGVKFGFSLTQLAKVNLHIPSLQQYVDHVRKFWNTKIGWTARADATLKFWQNLGQQDMENFSGFLLDMTTASDKAGRALTNEEMAALMEQYRFSDDMYSLYDQIKGDFDLILDTIERTTMAEIARNFRDNPYALEAETRKVQEEMAKLRDRNYFPLARFGDYTVHFRALAPTQLDGQSYAAGETISFEQYSTPDAARARRKELQRQFRDRTRYDVSTGKISDVSSQFGGLSPTLVAALKKMLHDSAPEGTSQLEVTQQLNELIYRTAPARSWKKHLLSRKGTAGYSLDTMRGYAEYMNRFANHAARLEHYADLQDSIRGVEDTIREGALQGKDTIKRGEIRDHLKRHFEYIMNPKNELANLRAFGFLWYLGAVPKSAVLNLTQVPLVAYPHLAAKFGDARTVRELGRAMKLSLQMMKDPSSISAELGEAISRAITDGFLNESLASDLAAVAEGGHLQRFLGGEILGSPKTASNLRKMSYYAAWMFQKAELANRYVTFIAAYNLATQTGMSPREAYLQGRDAVESSQYEYARWNRPEMMRGKRSVIFLFMQYVQNTMFFAFGGDKGWWRFWLMMLAMAGYQGLPMAENAADVTTFALRKYGKYAGWSNPELDVRVAIRQTVAELGINPDLLAHGFGRTLFGAPQIFSGKSPAWAPEWMGQSEDTFRGFDMSGSISMGRVIPGTEALASSHEDVLGNMAVDVGGAFYSIPLTIIQALNDDHPDVFKRWERTLPVSAKNLSKSYNMIANEGVTNRQGAQVAEVDVTDPWHIAEIIGQAGGFIPSRIAQVREEQWQLQQSVRYWQTRRTILMRDYTWAKLQGNSEAADNAMGRIRKYNETVFDNKLRIRGQDLSQSLQNQAKDRRKTELGIPQSPRFGGVYEEVESAYPKP